MSEATPTCYCGARLVSYEELLSTGDAMDAYIAGMVGPDSYYCGEEDDVVPAAWLPGRTREAGPSDGCPMIPREPEVPFPRANSARAAGGYKPPLP
jgi:hypothetical protein